MVPRRRARNLTDEVVQVLLQRIHNGEYQAGEKLPSESAMIADYGVSRTVIREAISRLQARGLVETKHGIGTFLCASPGADGLQISPDDVVTMLDVMAILELRISLESEAAGLAAKRRTDAQLQSMRTILDDFSGHVGSRNSDTVELDRAFHLLVAASTRNRYFHDILDQLGKLIIPRARLNSAAIVADDESSYLERVHLEHESIFRAIESQDSETARAAMRTHLSNSRDRLRRFNLSVHA